MGSLRVILAIFVLCGVSLVSGTFPVAAQEPYGRPVYYPLQSTSPQGMAGDWAAKIGKGAGGYFQPIRIELPGGGSVTYYEGGPERTKTLAAPAQAGFRVGPVYRLKIADMPDFPGTDLYPTVEVLDRLHPPAGRKEEFPVPIQFTEEEIQMAIEGRLVTKIVYLEQPNRAQTAYTAFNGSLPPRAISPRENALFVADQAGRPMLIVRMGGRVPSPDNEPPAFYGSGAPLQFAKVPQPEVNPE